MKRWLITLAIAVGLVLIGYEASKLLYISLTMKGTARSGLDRVAMDKKLQQVRLPEPPHVWPDAENFLKRSLVKKALELEIPVGEEDIAIWHDRAMLYCRIAWYQDLKLLTFPVGSILLDVTEEVPIR